MQKDILSTSLNHDADGIARRSFLGLSAALAMGVPHSAFAQADYPSKSVTTIVPYAPGGQGDVFARLLGDRLTRVLKHPFIVDNRPGASGALGARLVAKAKGDGYTLLLGQTGEIAVNGSVMKNPGYDALKELKPVALVGDAPLVLIAPANAPYNTIQELVQFARSKAGGVSYGSSGTATPGHLAAAALALGTKTEMIHIPYKGAGQAMTDVIGGQVNFFFPSASAAMPHIKNGKVKALAVSGPKRVAALPNVPTVAETVIPGFSFSLWGGYFAPAETPDAVVQLLNREINKLLSEPELRARFEADSSAIEPMSPAQFASYVANETKKYEGLVKSTGIQAD
ncbi:Bug family tripartite tricarboxylate transporter substrate binding protein [Ottowia thiooxydans]|uniref:Bug family tripartite tricarboxylate transporter substrate binding protein n=1 Tax=Ottowia thiooxydans TaxID=219182 RepID=UPI000684B2F2|nr:tripartite tricarboxylate transporter substrate binding protein [Ottowia thiooxydans]